METVTILLAILQTMAISLGVGSSTIAILNFFVAIRDGKISPEERAMMGIVYIVLRVAMVAILLTTFVLALLNAQTYSSGYFSDYKIAIWTLIFTLFFNAFLMTKHLVPSSIGPAIQAGSWYTLGIITSLLPLNLDNFTYFHFVLGYLLVLTLAVSLVNGVMLYLKHKKNNNLRT